MIIPDQPEADYHAHASVSRSGLWELYRKTPAHFRYRKPQKTKSMELGAGVHLAALQPELFDKMVVKGGKDRRGNQWKDLVEECNAYGGIPLIESEYEKAQRIRDSVHRIPEVQRILRPGAMIEHSAYWIDEETGIECRCRPDIVAPPELKVIADLKSTEDASEFAWSRSSSEYGYYLQDAMYSEGWEKAGGGEVLGFFFIAIEKEYPHLAQLHEHPISAIVEGRAVMSAALRRYKTCRDEDYWPGYPPGIQETDIRQYAYRETNRYEHY